MSLPSKILMLYTGGTIGMMQDPDTGSLRPFDFQQLLDQIPEIGLYECEITTDSLDRPIDSSDMKPEHWIRLAKRIAHDYEKYDGFVILHGSDTMAFTSSALSFLLEGLEKPVILTGSQLPIGISRSDARENLLTALEIALAQHPDGSPKVPEVAVYFEYDLLRGNRIHKFSTEDFEAFQSLNYPKLAEAGVHIKYNFNAIHSGKNEALKLHTHLDENVAILTVFPGMLPAYVNPVLQNPEVKGIILRTFGSGNAPTDQWFIDELKKTINRGTPIINISQCNGGGVMPGKYEAGKGLVDAGVISGKDMTLEAGLTKLMFLLAQNLSPQEFKTAFETNLRGELSE